MNRAPTIIAAIFGLTLFGGAAHADFTACNKTGNDVAIAVAVETNTAATSYGWWVVTPGACETILETDETTTSVYAYARHHVEAGGWTGDETFCIDTGRFEIAGRDQCFARGFKPVGFFKIDMKTSQDLRYDFVE